MYYRIFQTRGRSELTSSQSFRPLQNVLSRSLRLVPKSKAAASTTSPWLDGVLQTWDNPVFKPSEPQIQRIFSQGQEMDNGMQSSIDDMTAHHPDTQNKISATHSVLKSCKLSKESLRNAQVIAQVDKKFILAKIRRLSTSVNRFRAASRRASYPD